MKILVIVSDFPKVTETFVLRNVQHYLRMGHAVQVFHLKPFRTGETLHSDFADVTDRGFGLPWLSLPALVEFLRAPHRVLGCAARIISGFVRAPRHMAISLALIPKALALAAECRRSGTQHIHAEFAGYPATVAWIVARLTGIPFSFSAHAHDIFLTQGLLARKTRDARFVRAISQFNKRFIEALPDAPEDRVEVLRCGVAVPDAPQLRRRSGPFRILFVGALLPRKGVDVLLEAVRALPEELDWTLDILGGGSQDAALRAMADGLPQIRFHGPQPSDKVRDAMTGADVIVVPSRETAEGRSEGIPVVLMEAMSLGRAVIASRLSGIPELVIDNETGLLIEPDDVDGLSRALTRLAGDDALSHRLAQAGHARVAEEFNIEKTAQQLLDRMIEETS